MWNNCIHILVFTYANGLLANYRGWSRDEILTEKGYLGRPDFLRNVAWLVSNVDDKLDMLYTSTLVEPVFCSIIGDIPPCSSLDELSIKGDFDSESRPHFEEARMLIRLVRPRSPVYSGDYDVMLKNFKAVLDILRPPRLSDPFLLNDEFHLNHRLCDTMVRIFLTFLFISANSTIYENNIHVFIECIQAW